MANRFFIPSLGNAAGGTGTVKKKKKKKETNFSKFVSKGGVAGWLNRNRKKLKAMSKEDLTLFKKNGKKKSTTSKNKIAGAGDTPGAARAKAMAKARIKSGKTIAQAEAERDAKMKKGLKERQAAWKKARKEGKLDEWEKKYHPDRTPQHSKKKKVEKKKKKKSEIMFPTGPGGFRGI